MLLLNVKLTFLWSIFMSVNKFQSTSGSLEYSDSGLGQPVLAVHGAMGGYDQSEILAKTILPQNLRVIAVSRPGYLGTPLSSGATPEQQADRFVELLDYLGLAKVIVVAISGGGYSSIFFANRYPSRCKGLILCSSTGGPNDSKVPFSFSVFTFLSRFQFLVKFLQKQSEKNIEKALKRAIPQDDIRANFLQDEQSLALYKELSSGMFKDLHLRLAGTKNDIEVTKKLEYPLKSITVPTLIIHGTSDQVVPFEKHGKRLAEEIPNSNLYLAERGEHVTIFTHRQTVCQKVEQFLDSIFHPRKVGE